VVSVTLIVFLVGYYAEIRTKQAQVTVWTPIKLLVGPDRRSRNVPCFWGCMGLTLAASFCWFVLKMLQVVWETLLASERHQRRII
jgi:hypothetical protein